MSSRQRDQKHSAMLFPMPGTFVPYSSLTFTNPSTPSFIITFLDLFWPSYLGKGARCILQSTLQFPFIALTSVCTYMLIYCCTFCPPSDCKLQGSRHHVCIESRQVLSTKALWLTHLQAFSTYLLNEETNPHLGIAQGSDLRAQVLDSGPQMQSCLCLWITV